MPNSWNWGETFLSMKENWLSVLCFMLIICMNSFFCLFVCFDTRSHFVIQAGVQWYNHISLQLPTPGLKWLSCLSFPNSRGYRCALPHQADFFFFFIETRFLHVGQAGLELLTSGDPPTLASQSARITGISHCAWPYSRFLLAQKGGKVGRGGWFMSVIPALWEAKAMHAGNPSYSGGWGARIVWTWEVEVAVSWDHAIAFEPGQQREILSQKINK